MKRILLLVLLVVGATFAQTRVDEKLANFTDATSVNSALVKAASAISGTGIANQLTYWTGASTVGSLATGTYPSLTEMTYLKGVTSKIQTQINGKSSSTHVHTITNITGLQTALDSKQAVLVSGTSIKTINGQSILGAGNITVATTLDTTGLWLKIYNIVKAQLESDSETIIGTKAELDSMIIDFRKNNYLRVNK